MENSKIQEISQQMIARYSKRYNELGYHVHTLGWGSKEQQDYRFAQTLSEISFTPKKNILDIGCGFGDYLAMLIAQKKDFANYYGWDINPDLIGEAKKIWQNNKKAQFEVQNINILNSLNNVADIGVMLGVLNLNLEGKVDNYEYSFNLIKNAFSYVKEVLVIDFLSIHRATSYEKEDFVFYHDPKVVLNFALSLTDNVVLKHNYAQIPQKEFMLYIYK